MKNTLITISLIASAGIANAAVSFTGGGADDFWHTTANWTHDVGDGHTGGLPQGGEATTIVNGQNAVVNANDTAGIGALTVEDGASLTINSGVTLQLNNTKPGIVDGTLNVAGKYTLLGGGGSNLTINSTGDVNVTGTLDARKSTTIAHGGSLSLASTAGTWVPQDKFAVGNASTLHFDVINGSVSTIAGSTVNLDLHLDAILSMDLTNTGVGTYDLITGIQNIRWYNAGAIVNDRTFGSENITNLGTGLTAYVEYDHSGGTGSRAVRLVVVPEPSSTALLGLGGLALMLRRRKIV